MAAEAGALHSEGGKRCAAQAMHELAAAQHDALQHAARGGPEEQAALLQLLTLTPTPTPTRNPNPNPNPNPTPDPTPSPSPNANP